MFPARIDLRHILLLVCAVAFPVAQAGCSQPSASLAPAPPSSAAPAARQSLGNVMAEVARRFEIAGRAANANRYELAEFEVGELEELFESDVPNAELPKEGPTAHIPAVAKAFLQTNAPELKKAAASRDRAAFALAFQHTAAACNACHKASDKAFLQVPSEPGKTVPDLDPLPATGPAPSGPPSARPLPATY
jgi:hypothetical protein